MKTTTLLYGLIAILVIGAIVWFVFFGDAVTSEETPEVVTPTQILSFEDCQKAGYPVVENERRQCTTPDGRTFAEETPVKITYTNATAEQIQVELPFPGAVTGKEFSVIGMARGTWFFEASFPVGVFDSNEVLLASGVAQAQGEWMTEDFVPFKVDIKMPENFNGPAILVLRKDNPSGLPENDASISFPITVEY